MMRFAVVLTANSLMLLPALLEADQIGALEDCVPATTDPTEWAAKSLESADTVFLGVAISVDVPAIDDDSVPGSPTPSSMEELLQMIQSSPNLASPYLALTESNPPR